MGHSTTSGRSMASAGSSREITPERREALSFNARSTAIQNMVFEEYGSGSRAVVPGVGTATVTYDETRGGYVGEFHLDREGVTRRVGSRSDTLAKMERRVKAAMMNSNRRGLSESARRAIRATEYSARSVEEERRRGREAARNMTRYGRRR